MTVKIFEVNKPGRSLLDRTRDFAARRAGYTGSRRVLGFSRAVHGKRTEGFPGPRVLAIRICRSIGKLLKSATM